MDFDFSEELNMLRETARNFAETRIAPHVEEDEKTHKFRPEIVREMGELGLFGMIIPEEYGGTGLGGYLGAAVASEEFARVSASWGLPFNMQMMGPANTILLFGTEAQKKKYIPPLVAGEKLGAFAITEPNSGSDVASMRTTAVLEGDSWVINGQKMWISNAHVADTCLLYAVTDKEKKAKGLSCFVVELKNTKGVTARPIETKLGLHCAPTGELAFDNARIPKDAILGAPGDGFKICMTQLDNTRLSCAARAVGVGQACIDASVKYSKERTQFGKPLKEFQMIQSQIADMFLEHEAAKFLVYRAAWMKDAHPQERSTILVSTAKVFAAEAAVHAANLAVKIHGSYGFSDEYPVGRYLRDAKSFEIVEGTSNIQRMIIARHLLD
jgi:glutaryl-CoA dehydrogenase (non-decarboxylating)